MKHIKYLLITIFLLFLPAKAFAVCDNITRNSVTNGNLNISFINSDDSTGSAVANLNNSVLLPVDTKSITQVSKNIVTTFSGDFLILNGSLEIVSFANLSSSGHNANFPNLQSLPSPSIILNSDTTKESYCEIISITNGNLPIVYDYNGNSPMYRLASFSYSLKCHRHQNFPSTSTVYRVSFYLDFGNLNGTSIGLDTGYYISNNYRATSLTIDDSCSIDNLIGEIQALGFDVSDINDNIVDVGDKLDNIGDFLSDDSVSASVLGATNFFNQQDGSYYGLADFVSAIINFMKAIYNDYSCTPLQLPSILGTTLTLPCFSEWLHDFNETIYNLWKMVLYFYVGFVICSDLIKFIHDLRDPQNDNLTVMDI